VICVCVQNKVKLIFLACRSKVNDLFDLVHCDIWTLYKVVSSCGAHYFLTIVDDASGVVQAYLMRDKSKADHFLKTFIAMAKIQFGKGVKVVRSDNGAEFKFGPILKFYFDNDIMHQTSCVDTPQ